VWEAWEFDRDILALTGMGVLFLHLFCILGMLHIT